MIKADPLEVRNYLVAYLESHSGERAPSRDLFREYRRRWLGQSATDKVSADMVVSFVRNLDRVATYRELVDGTWPTLKPKPVSDDWLEFRLKGLVTFTRQTSAVPLLMSAARRPGELGDILRVVDLFAIRYQLSRGHPSPLGDVLYKAAGRIRLDPAYGAAQLQSDLADLAARNADDARFESSLRTAKYGSVRTPLLKYFLVTLDAYAASHLLGEDPPKLDDTSVVDMSKVDLDHMYPNNAAPQGRNDDLEVVKNQIANLSPLIWGKNRGIEEQGILGQATGVQELGVCTCSRGREGAQMGYRCLQWSRTSTHSNFPAGCSGCQ